MKNQKKTLQKEINISRITDLDILLLSKNLAMSLKSGLTLVDALEMQIIQARGRLKKIISELVLKLKNGDSFGVALACYPKYFSSLYVNMVKTGEKTGTLQENLERLTIHLEKIIKVKKKIKGAMIYPAFIFISVAGLGWAIVWLVLPKIVPLFVGLGLDLPLSTKMLIYISNVLERHTFEMVTLMVITFALFRWLLGLSFVKPFSHALLLKIPVVKGIAKNVNLERFTRSFGTLLDSGLTVDESLKIMRESTDNWVYKKAISNIIPKIECGNSLNDTLGEYPKLFPVTTAKILGLGEMTGNLDHSLKYLSDFYEDEVDEIVKNLSNIVEPVLLIIIGLMVGFVAISIIGPIYEITGNIRT